jgi:hypothetical protein
MITIPCLFGTIISFPLQLRPLRTLTSGVYLSQVVCASLQEACPGKESGSTRDDCDVDHSSIDTHMITIPCLFGTIISFPLQLRPLRTLTSGVYLSFIVKADVDGHPGGPRDPGRYYAGVCE